MLAIVAPLIPGPYTFILPATKQVPKLVMNSKRKTSDIRVPESPICQTILATLGNPIISASAHVVDDSDPDRPTPYLSRAELFDQLENSVDLIVDNGMELGYQTSTILDMTEREPTIVRRGLGYDAVDMFEMAV